MGVDKVGQAHGDGARISDASSEEDLSIVVDRIAAARHRLNVDCDVKRYLDSPSRTAKLDKRVLCIFGLKPEPTLADILAYGSGFSPDVTAQLLRFLPLFPSQLQARCACELWTRGAFIFNDSSVCKHHSADLVLLLSGVLSGTLPWRPMPFNDLPWRTRLAWAADMIERPPDVSGNGPCKTCRAAHPPPSVLTGLLSSADAGVPDEPHEARQRAALALWLWQHGEVSGLLSQLPSAHLWLTRDARASGESQSPPEMRCALACHALLAGTVCTHLYECLDNAACRTLDRLAHCLGRADMQRHFISLQDLAERSREARCPYLWTPDELERTRQRLRTRRPVDWDDCMPDVLDGVLHNVVRWGTPDMLADLPRDYPFSRQHAWEALLHRKDARAPDMLHALMDWPPCLGFVDGHRDLRDLDIQCLFESGCPLALALALALLDHFAPFLRFLPDDLSEHALRALASAVPCDCAHSAQVGDSTCICGPCWGRRSILRALCGAQRPRMLRAMLQAWQPSIQLVLEDLLPRALGALDAGAVTALGNCALSAAEQTPYAECPDCGARWRRRRCSAGCPLSNSPAVKTLRHRLHGLPQDTHIVATFVEHGEWRALPNADVEALQKCMAATVTAVCQLTGNATAVARALTIAKWGNFRLFEMNNVAVRAAEDAGAMPV